MGNMPIKSSRAVPISLLKRQAERTKQSSVVVGSRSRMIMGSLRDLGSLLSVSQAAEDDEQECRRQKESLLAIIRSGEADSLLYQRFAVKNSQRESSASLLSKFTSTTADEGLIKVGVEEMNSRAWTDVPLIWKQVAFYQAFGSWGPREGMSFFGRRPEDFFIRGDMQLWKCTTSRRRQLKEISKPLDPLSKWVLCFGLWIGVLAVAKDFLRRQERDPEVTIAAIS